MKDPYKATSKFLSYVLRHQPEAIGLLLDENGWALVKELIEKMNAAGRPVTEDQLKFIVENNDKKRFSFSDDFTRIGASQGHSIDIDLQLKELIPPAVLFHGTAIQNIESIREKGILKGDRHHVHLSADRETAGKVGMRHGKPVIIEIDSKRMSEDGIRFFLSDNNVWLTDHVLPGYFLTGQQLMK